MLLVVDPGGVGLGVFLLLFAGGLGIVCPDCEPLAVGGERIAGDVNGQWLDGGGFAGAAFRGGRRDGVLLFGVIDGRQNLEIVRNGLAAAQVEAEELCVLATFGEKEDGGAVRGPLSAVLAALVRGRRKGKLAGGF